MSDDLKLDALKLAVQGREAGETPKQTVERAAAFANFLSGCQPENEYALVKGLSGPSGIYSSRSFVEPE